MEPASFLALLWRRHTIEHLKKTRSGGDPTSHPPRTMCNQRGGGLFPPKGATHHILTSRYLATFLVCVHPCYPTYCITHK